MKDLHLPHPLPAPPALVQMLVSLAIGLHAAGWTVSEVLLVPEQGGVLQPRLCLSVAQVLQGRPHALGPLCQYHHAAMLLLWLHHEGTA